MGEDWIGRWREGRIGWHETEGNAGLKSHWPQLPAGIRVLVPLCGKSPDLEWLAARNYNVTGVELSEIAVNEFFAERGMAPKISTAGTLTRFATEDDKIEIYCGDYLDFSAKPFDAYFDRGALVAIDAVDRPRYVEHSNNLLKEDATRLVVTLEYDQSKVSGPPYSVMPDELVRYWKDMQRVEEKDDLPTSPPKFRAAGLTDVKEVFWLSR